MTLHIYTFALQRLQRFSVLAAIIILLTSCSNYAFQGTHLMQPIPKEVAHVTQEVQIPQLNSALKGQEFIHGWYLHAKNPHTLLLYFHGNAQNRSYHVFYTLPWLKKGFDVLIIDYRGYGESLQRATFNRAIDDVKATLHFAKAHYNLPKIALGASLGGALLLNALSSEDEALKAAIIDSTYASLPAIFSHKLASHWYSWPVSWLPYLLLTSQYDPIKQLPHIKTPLLFVACSHDVVISPNDSWQLFDATQSNRAFWLQQGCGHIEATLQPVFFDDIATFSKERTINWPKSYDVMRIYSATESEF